MKSQHAEYTLYLSYDTSVWLRLAAAAMEKFSIHVQKKIFSAVSSEFPYFHFPTESNNERVQQKYEFYE
jgi:hypothetical protein